MSYFSKITYSDTGSLDAFSRLRTSSPETIFAVQCQYGVEAIQMESGATGTGVVPSHDSNTRMVTLSATAGSGTSYMQSYQYSPYEPGMSQFIATTFNLGTAVAGATVDVGYFDASNGVFLRQNGTTNYQVCLRTATSGTPSDLNIANQADWNIDPMLDGTGPSGKTIVFTKAQILVIDLQFLGMGRVRVGFDVDGVIYYVHEFKNANNLTLPYMQSATLPIQMLVTATSTATTKTAYFKCATVHVEAGKVSETGFIFSTPETTATAGSGTRVPLISVRPKTTYAGIVNRALFIAQSVSLINTGANPVFWELVLGGNYSGQAWSDVNATYSGMEYSSTPGTFTNLTGGIVIQSGYASQTAGGAGGVSVPNTIGVSALQSMKFPISLDRAGAVRALGTLTLLVTGIGGTSACRGSVNYKEIR